jgi:hypothetical protein
MDESSFPHPWKRESYYASLDDLIEMKKAARRPKDIEDLKALLHFNK